MATVVDTTRKGISIVVGAAMGGGAATGGGANARWFGDGRDGALNVADGQTLALPVALDEGQIVKQYTSGYIGTGSLLTAANRCNGMVLLFTGDLTIKGTISMDKKAPLLNPMEEQCAAEAHVALCGGLMGGNGGTAGVGGGTEYQNPSIHTPGAGGNGFAFGGGFGGGSASAYMNGGPGDPRPPIGTTIPFTDPNTNKNGTVLYGSGGNIYAYQSPNYVTLWGGAGPGGSGASSSYMSDSYSNANGNPGDAIGGGAIFIFVKGRLAIEATGIITADGGNGAAGVGTYRSGSSEATGGGGAGGGGIIAIVHNGDYSNMGSIAASGGTGGAKHPHYGGASGADGAIGTVLITTLSDLLAA